MKYVGEVIDPEYWKAVEENSLKQLKQEALKYMGQEIVEEDK